MRRRTPLPLAFAVALSASAPVSAASVVDWPLPVRGAAAQPDLSVAPDGDLLLSWTEPRGDGHRLRFARHRGGDATRGWSAVRTVASGDDWFVNWADFPAVQALADGSLWAHALVRNGAATYAYDTRLFVSRDGGTRWRALGAVHDDGTPTEHGFATLWPQSDDALGIAWLDGRHTGGGGHGAGHHGNGAAMTLRAATFGADGGKRTERELDAMTCDCCQTASARDGDASLVAWRDRTPADQRDVVVARYADGAWQAPVVVHRDGWKTAACPVNGPAIAARDGRAWVAWFTEAGGTPSVRIAASEDGGRSFGPMRALATGPRQHGRVDIAADAAGVWTTWVEEADGIQSLWIAHHAPDLAGERFRTRVATIAGRGRATGFPRLQVRDGAAWIAWTEIVDGAPRLRGAVVRPRVRDSLRTGVRNAAGFVADERTYRAAGYVAD